MHTHTRGSHLIWYQHATEWKIRANRQQRAAEPAYTKGQNEVNLVQQYGTLITTQQDEKIEQTEFKMQKQGKAKKRHVLYPFTPQHEKREPRRVQSLCKVQYIPLLLQMHNIISYHIYVKGQQQQWQVSCAQTHILVTRFCDSPKALTDCRAGR